MNRKVLCVGRWWQFVGPVDLEKVQAATKYLEGKYGEAVAEVHLNPTDYERAAIEKADLPIKVVPDGMVMGGNGYYIVSEVLISDAA